MVNVRTQLRFYSVLLAIALTQTAAADKPRSFTVENDGFVGTLYEPTESTDQVGIFVLGGSEGGIPDRQAKAFAAQGYPTLAIGFFKLFGTPEYLDEVPLEYFDKPLAWFSSQPFMKDRKVVVVGSSKGAEVALLLATRKPQINGVIAIAPSSVVFQGIPKSFWPPRSSWTEQEKPVAFVPYDISKGIDVKKLRPMYEQTLTQTDAVEKATIPIEKVNGPVLLLSGVDDTMWPSSEMAEAIVGRNKENGSKIEIKHVKYEAAGHTLNEFFMMGGTKDGNRKARIDSTRRISEFLSKIN